MPGLRNSFGSFTGADSARLSSLQRSTSSSRLRTPARLAARRQVNSAEPSYDVSGIPICSTSGSNWAINMLHFKPHELANCLESCAALSYDPGHTVLDGIAKRMGRSATANRGQSKVSGKPSLTPGAKRIVVPSSPSAGHLSALIKAPVAATCGSAPAV
ncbi:hypothetical protein WJX82_010171 [Trebouxia sp. C0006]